MGRGGGGGGDWVVLFLNTPPYLRLPCDHLVVNGEKKSENRDKVSDAVANERPPIEVDDTSGEEGAHANNEHYIENGRTDNTTDTYIVL